ncbi:MAG: M48 family metalloprotease [Candidatus Omnitrophota bacterium]
MKKIITLLIVLVLFLTGCAGISSFNPATGKKEMIFISTASEISMGQNVHTEMLKKYKLSQDKVKTEKLDAVGQRLASVSDRQDYKYKFYLIDKDEINAFTTSGANIYMFTGLFDKLKSDDEIAAVLAHEIGHCAAKHVVKRMQAELGYNLISSLLLSQIKTEQKQKEQIASAAGAAMQLATLGYSRQDEYAADTLSIKYMYAAKFGPNAIIKVLELLKENSKGSQGPIILRSHPYLEDRMANAKIEIEKQKGMPAGSQERSST